MSKYNMYPSPHNSEQLWLQSPNEVYGHYFYIHRRIANIGKLGGKAESNSDLIRIFSQYKQDAAIAAKRQYVDYIVGSTIGLTDKEKQIIEEALNNENTGDKVLSRLHQVLQQAFEEQVDSSKVIDAMQKQAALNWSSTKDSQANSLDKILQSNGMEENLKGFKFLDEILQVLEYTCKMLGTEYGRGLALILELERKSFNKSQSSFSLKTSKTVQLGKNLEKALDKFEQVNNGGSLSKKDLEEGQAAAQLIRNFASTLAKNQTKTGEKEGKFLSVRALQSLFQQNIFPTLIELMVNSADQEIRDNVYEAVGAAVNSINQSATDISFIQAYDTQGKRMDGYILKNVGEREGKETKDYGKADQLMDTSVKMSRIIGKGKGEVQMSIGISTKAYVSNSIGVPLDKNYEKFSLGRGLNLGQVLNRLIPGFGVREKYLAYNVLSKDKSSLGGALVALQDLILTRGIPYLVSGRGPGDSAQLLFINGNIMSMWDVIQYAMNNNIGKSGSMLGTRIKSGNDNGMYMSLENRPNIIKYGQDKNWYKRIVNTNNEIEKAVIQLEIIPKKIIDYATTLT